MLPLSGNLANSCLLFLGKGQVCLLMILRIKLIYNNFNRDVLSIEQENCNTDLLSKFNLH